METLLHYQCGHVADADVPRKKLDVDCYDCTNMAAQVVGALRGLPALAGTEKQVAWGETIRLAKLGEVEDYVGAWDLLPPAQRHVMEKPAHAALRNLGRRLSAPARAEIEVIAAEELNAEAAAVRCVPERLQSVSWAEWWIERRRWPAKRIIADFLKG